MAKQKKNNHPVIPPAPREAVAAPVQGEEDFVELLRRELVASATAAPCARFPAHTKSQLRGHGQRATDGEDQDLNRVVPMGQGVCGPMKSCLPLCALCVFACHAKPEPRKVLGACSQIKMRS
jgi:hypothetical protein